MNWYVGKLHFLPVRLSDRKAWLGVERACIFVFNVPTGHLPVASRGLFSELSGKVARSWGGGYEAVSAAVTFGYC